MSAAIGLVEHDRGVLQKTSLEMLTVARGLAADLDGDLGAILIGEEARPLAERLPQYGVSDIYLLHHEALADYSPEAWAVTVLQVIESESPGAVLAAGTDRGNEVMAHVAARADLPFAANCTQVQPSDGSSQGTEEPSSDLEHRSDGPYQITRARWGGSLFEEALLEGQPKLLTTAPLAVPAAQAQGEMEATVHEMTASLEDKDFRVTVTDRVEEGDTISLADARLVVGGGRGVGGPEGFEPLEELADLLGGAVGGSRVATNNGWRPHSDQIGQTGARIAPDLYIACGISGATQHMVGCRGSKNILAINTDPEAPIVSKADYAAIGDLHEIVPALCAAIKEVRKGQSNGEGR